MKFTPSHSTHTPPPSSDKRVDWLRLLRSRRVGISTFYRLLDEYGSAKAALAELPNIAQKASISKYEVFSQEAALREIKAGYNFGAELIPAGDPKYPKLLTTIDNAPPLLWMKGDFSLLERPTIAIVGSRNASAISMRFTRHLTQTLGHEEFAIISGLARGIDTAAHLASLETGTIAVLAGGLDVVYPYENKALYNEISTQGLLISEQPIGMRPLAKHFPMRNRIVSGMARATIITEAAAKSGSLITAEAALSQGREVMAVPSHPFDGRASGCNKLIKDGAVLIRSARDVIDALAFASAEAQTQSIVAREVIIPPAAPEETRSLKDHAKLHQMILSRLSTSPISEDELIRNIGASAQVVSSEVQSLEIEGKISRSHNGMISIN